MVKPAEAMGEAECRQCGACCRGLPVRIDPKDIAREPRLAPHAPVMAIGTNCPFLVQHGQGAWECSIYKTRPRVCQEFTVAGVLCGQARQLVGLELLKRDR